MEVDGCVVDGRSFASAQDDREQESRFLSNWADKSAPTAASSIMSFKDMLLRQGLTCVQFLGNCHVHLNLALATKEQTYG